MAHSHSVYDTDIHFVIDTITRAIKGNSRKTILMQGDHNSERFSFSLDRYIEGHDMALCNQVEVHYLNIDTKTRESKSGLYTVDDFQVSETDENTVNCSWLISKNATQLCGSLSFLLNFRCLEDGFENYSWHSDIYKDVRVAEGINADFEYTTEYVDVIEQWKESVMATFTEDISRWERQTTASLEEKIDNQVEEYNTIINARINNIIAHNNDTNSNTELLDIRVGANGKIYDSAGESVREQYKDCKEDLNALAIIEKYPNLITDYTLREGRLLNNVGWTEENANYNTLNAGIPVKENTTYTFSVDSEPIVVAKVVYKDTDSIAGGVSGYIGSHTNVATFTTPVGCSYVFVSDLATTEFTTVVLQEASEPKSLIPSVTLKQDILPNIVKSNLYGKKMMTLGDSLTEGGFWQKYVADRLGLSGFIDLGIGGSKVNVFADNVTKENIADVDIVTVMGVFNSSSSKAGTIEDEASNEPNASICAGYKYIVEKILTLKPSVKIVLMSPHRPRANDVAHKAEAVGNVAKYYGLPFIDIYNTAGFNGFTYDIYLRDTVHSSYGDGGGYEREAEVIAGGLIHYFG